MQINFRDIQRCDTEQLRRLWEWAIKQDAAYERMKANPPSSRSEIMIQLAWLGVV